MNPDSVEAAAMHIRVDASLPTFQARVGKAAPGQALVLETAIARIPVMLDSRETEPVSDGHVLIAPVMASMLGVHDGDPVAGSATSVGTGRSVEVTPLFPLSVRAGVSDEVLRTLLAERIPLQAGIRFRSPFRPGGYPGLFEIARVDVADGEIGLADRKTRVLLVAEGHHHSHDHSHAHLAPENGLRTFVGYESLKRQLRDAVEFSLLSMEYQQLGLPALRGVLLHGPAGVGKTQLARSLAQEFGYHVVVVEGAAVASGARGAGEAALREAFQEAVDRAPSLVVLDEIDAIAPGRRNLSSQSDYRLVAQLLTLMDGFGNFEGAVVIATTNRPDAIDRALRRPGRLDLEIAVGMPNEADRAAILGAYLGRMPLEPAALSCLPEFAARTHGYVAADLLAICQAAGVSAVRRAMTTRRAGVLADIAVTAEDIERAGEDVAPSLLRGSVGRRPRSMLGELGLDRAEELLAKLLGPAPENPAPQRVLVVGAKLSDASALAESLAAEVGGYFFEITPADVLTAWFGETETAVRDVFELARMVAPAVLHIRNVPSLTPASRESSIEQSRRIGDQLAYEMERAGPLHVIASCADPDEVDPAVRLTFDEVVTL